MRSTLIPSQDREIWHADKEEWKYKVGMTTKTK